MYLSIKRVVSTTPTEECMPTNRHYSQHPMILYCPYPPSPHEPITPSIHLMHPRKYYPKDFHREGKANKLAEVFP